MRIIAGSKRGKKMITLEGEKLRPTTDRVKESLFNILQFRIEGRSFLDLFAGSGQIGLEALSRGASQAFFVDNNRSADTVLRQNIKSTGFESKSEIYIGDYRSFLAHTGNNFDMIFLDPPYLEDMFESALEAAVDYVKLSGLMVCEHPSKIVLPETVKNFGVHKSYRYGKIMLTVYQAL